MNSGANELEPSGGKSASQGLASPFLQPAARIPPADWSRILIRRGSAALRPINAALLACGLPEAGARPGTNFPIGLGARVAGESRGGAGAHPPERR